MSSPYALDLEAQLNAGHWRVSSLRRSVLTAGGEGEYEAAKVDCFQGRVYENPGGAVGDDGHGWPFSCPLEILRLDREWSIGRALPATDLLKPRGPRARGDLASLRGPRRGAWSLLPTRSRRSWKPFITQTPVCLCVDCCIRILASVYIRGHWSGCGPGCVWLGPSCVTLSCLSLIILSQYQLPFSQEDRYSLSSAQAFYFPYFRLHTLGQRPFSSLIPISPTTEPVRLF